MDASQFKKKVDQTRRQADRHTYKRFYLCCTCGAILKSNPNYYYNHNNNVVNPIL